MPKCKPKINRAISQRVEFLKRVNAVRHNKDENDIAPIYKSLGFCLAEVRNLKEVEIFDEFNIQQTSSTHVLRFFNVEFAINTKDYIRLQNGKLLIVDSKKDEKEMGIITNIKATLQGTEEI